MLAVVLRSFNGGIGEMANTQIFQQLAVAFCLLATAIGESEAENRINIVNINLPGTSQVSREYIRQGIWRVNCWKDEMDDTKACDIRQLVGTDDHPFRRSDLTILVREELGTLIIIGSGSYPGTEEIIRIDSEPPIRYNEKEVIFVEGQLLNDLMSGSMIMTRWFESPSHARRDQKIPLKGFAYALKTAKKIVNGENFSIPRESLDNLYWWQGRTFSEDYRIVQRALSRKEKSSYPCTAPTFDLEAKKEEALQRLPDVAGESFRQGFQHEAAESKSEPNYLHHLPPRCAERISRLQRQPELVPGLLYE